MTVEDVTSPTAPAPGWFPDPGGSGAERWWSGETWTEYTREAPAPAPAPAMAEPAAPAVPVATPAPAATATPAFVAPTASAAPAFVAPTASAAPAPSPLPRLDLGTAGSPVGFTSGADPEVASRYRQATQTVEPSLAYGSGVSRVGGSPTMPGWAGMPLPGASAAPGSFGPANTAYAPMAGSPSPAYAASAGYAPTPGYTPTPNYGVPDGANKTAWTAFASGALALGLSIAFLFFDRIGLWPTLLALAAIVQGIIGLVRVSKARTGLWPSIGALVLGLAAIGVMATALFSWVLTPAWDEFAVEQDIVDTASTTWQLDVVSADCPSDPPLSDGSHFTCTAYGGDGTSYVVDVDIADGTYAWTFNG